MAVKIKLKRMGKIRAPFYRIVVADSRTKRDGVAIEEIGKYHPKEQPSLIEVDSARAQHWLSVGAQPTEAVLALLKKTGDWQKFKGEPAPPPLQMAAPKADKKAIFEAAARAAADEPSEGATTPRTKKSPKPAEAAEVADEAQPAGAADAAPEQPAEQPEEQPAEAAQAADAAADAKPTEA